MKVAVSENIRLDELFVKTLFKNKADEVQNAMSELKSNKYRINDNIMNAINRFYTRRQERDE
jgi:hypothetical protein